MDGKLKAVVRWAWFGVGWGLAWVVLGCLAGGCALMRKEFLQLRRDTITLRMLVVIPVMQTLVFGYAINFDVKHLKTIVLDEDLSFDSRELVAKMTASEYFDVVGSVSSLDDLRREMDAGHASTALVIDRDFGKSRHQGVPARALLIVNASDTTTSTQAMSIAAGISNQLSVQTLARRAGWKDASLPVDLRVRPWYNPDLKTATFIIPGLIAILLTFTLIQFTAMAIVRERERGTLEQLQVTPVTRVEIILGKIFPFMLIGLFQLTLTIVLMRFLFRIPIAGSVAALYAVGLIFIAAVLGLGALLSTLAKTQLQAMQRRVQRSRFDLEQVFRSPLDVLCDGVAVRRAGQQRAKDDEVEGALEQFQARGWLSGHCVDTLLHIE